MYRSKNKGGVLGSCVGGLLRATCALQFSYAGLLAVSSLEKESNSFIEGVSSSKGDLIS